MKNKRVVFFFFWLIFVFLFILLGTWQLARYHYKKDLVKAATMRMFETPVAFQKNVKSFEHVKVTGRYVNGKTVLMQNRFHHHQLGVEVFTPLELGGGKWILVDRGWLPLLSDRQLPVIPPVSGVQHITGHIKPVGEYQFILGNNISDSAARPLVIQRMDIAEISPTLKMDLYPFVLRLDKTAPNGFTREWTVASVTAVPPERHLGYAFQWFAMALVLFLACIFFYCERVKDD